MKLIEQKLYDLYRHKPWRLIDDSLDASDVRDSLKDFARFVGIHESTASRWRRAYEDESDTGARSPVETTLKIFSWWLLHTPEFCLVYIQILQAIYDEHRSKFVEAANSAEARRQAIESTCQLMQAVATEADNGEIERLLASVIHNTRLLSQTEEADQAEMPNAATTM